MKMDLTQKADQLESALIEARRATLLPKPRLHVDEWSDQNRILPSETSSITGPWRTSQFEVARPFMRAFTEPGVRVMSAMASAQIMKTSGLENIIAYLMALDPGPMLMYEPTIQTVRRFDEDKLEPMIRATPALAELFGGRRALDNKNPNFLSGHKKFPGGFLYVLTSNSEENLAQTSARVVLYDEVDKMREVKGNDPISLGDERLKNFSFNGTSIRVSTPTVAGASPIASSYENSDQRKPYIKCPHCDEWHYMKWEQVTWDKDASGIGDPDTAAYVCEGCGTIWTEAERVRALTTDGGVYAFQTRPFECCGETQHPETERNWDIVDEYRAGYATCKTCGQRAVSNRHAGFWAWEAYHPGRPLSDTVRAFLDSKGDRNKLRNFVNSKLARTFSEEVDQSRSVDPDHIAARAEPPWPGVPAAVKIVTAGVDVQSGENGRLEIEVVGWGDGDESWSLDYQIFEGDPSKDEVWSALDDYLMTPVAGEDGRQHYIQAVCIDTGGHNAEQVMTFARARAKRRVWAVKGANEKAGSRVEIWPRKISISKHGGQLHVVGTQSAKDAVEVALQTTEPGPQYMHVPANRHESWFEQVARSEMKKVVPTDNGRSGTQWVPRPGYKRNEGLDCRVYAICALAGLRKAGVVHLQGAAGTGTQKPEMPAKAPEPDKPKATGKKARCPARRRRSSFWA